MSINQKHPDYVKFLRNEHKTLLFLQNTPFIENEFRELSISARNTLQTFGKLDERNIKRTNITFGTNFNIDIEKKPRKIIVESIILQEFSMASYVLSICEKCNTPYSLMRKFHFDYAIPSGGEEEKKPVYHLQYGGKQSPGLASLNIPVDDSFFPWLSSPRINHVPVNLALLLDTIFLEFKSEATDKVVKRPEWRKLIKENEDHILVPYYNNIGRFISSKYDVENLIRDFYYGG